MLDYSYWRENAAEYNNPDIIYSNSKDIFKTPTSKPYYTDRLLKRAIAADLHVWNIGNEYTMPGHSLINRVLTYDCYLHYVVDGTGTFCGQRVNPGYGFITWMGMPHTIISDTEKPWHYYWIGVRGSRTSDYLTRAGFTPGNGVYDYSGFAEEIKAIFNEMIYEDHSKTDISLYTQSCFLRILSYHRRNDSGDIRIKSGEKYVRHAIDYIDRNYMLDLSVEELAHSLYINRQYLYKVFREYCGMSPKLYITQKRMDAACALLRETDQTIGEIAKSVVYSDYTLFTRAFKKVIHRSASAYRNGQKRKSTKTK